MRWTGRLDEAELVGWGRLVGEDLADSRLFVSLLGDLGAGKSTFVRAVCRGAGVIGPVQSPTFTFIHRHARLAGGWLFHSDLYRLTDTDQLWDLGWSDLLESQAPIFVEWAERAEDHLPTDRWEIRLRLPDEPELRTSIREVSVTRIGQPGTLTGPQGRPVC